MAITSLATLKTAVATFMNRADFSADALTEIVQLAEARLNRELPLRVNWTIGTLTGTVDAYTLALPSGYVEARSLFIEQGSRRLELPRLAHGTFDYPAATSTGRPAAWSIIGTNIRLDRACDQQYTFYFHYRTAFALATTDPNWLLSNHPDIYLNACLLEACWLTKDQQFAAACKAKLDEGISELRRLDGKTDNAILLPDAALTAGRGYYDGANDVSV